MTTPGSGPQPPEQPQPAQPAWGAPSQPGQPEQQWGQPAQPAQPGQQWGQPGQQPGQQWGQPGQQPGQQWGQPGQQPGQPGQPWAPPAGPGAPEGAHAFGQPVQQSKKRKWIPAVGGVVAVAAVAVVGNSLLGGGDPDIGDCVKPDGDSFDVVDCSSDDAQAKVIGTDDDMTYDEMMSNDAACTKFPEATVVLWSGADEDEDGHVYCATDV